MFTARTDVYATRWENARTGRSGWVPAVADGWRKGKDRPYLRLTDTVVETHLTGEVHVGLHPMLAGDVCHWLAADFDGPSAMLDALSYLKAARAVGVPAALEVSRSGTGAHVRVFFTGPVAATTARAPGFLLRPRNDQETMNEREERGRVYRLPGLSLRAPEDVMGLMESCFPGWADTGGRPYVFSRVEAVRMTLMRLRRHVTFGELAEDFGISASTAWEHFQRIRDALAQVLAVDPEALAASLKGKICLVGATLVTVFNWRHRSDLPA